MCVIACCCREDIKCAVTFLTKTGFSSMRRMGKILLPKLVCPQHSLSCAAVTVACLLACVCSNQLEVLDVLEGRIHSISLPIKMKSVFLVAEDRWLLLESNTNK